MEHTDQTAGWGGTERKRVVAVVETLARLSSKGESLAEVAHDARNMVTALGLYCDLLEEPGVLATPFMHYGGELRLVATASRRLVEKLVALDTRRGPLNAATVAAERTENSGAEVTTRHPEGARRSEPGDVERMERTRRWEMMPAQPIASLAAELLANRNLLAALAGPSIAVTVDAEGGARPVRLTGEDLTRVLVNLVKNAAEAMPAGGRIQLGLREQSGDSGAAEWLSLTIEDNGPGIPEEALDKIFVSGYTTRAYAVSDVGGWPATHRGLGLAITRSIVEAAGGRVHAANRAQTNGDRPGTRIEIELPVAVR